MNRYLAVVVVLISISSGCAPKAGTMESRHRLTTPYTSLTVEGRYASKLDTITTNEDLQLTIDQVPENPVPGDPNNWIHHFRIYYHVGSTTPATITVHNTAPAAEIDGGWAYLDGDHPVGETKTGVGAGQGTRFIIQVGATEDLFVNTSSIPTHIVMVTNRVSGLQKQLDPGKYCFVKNDGTITGQTPISSSAAITAFVNEVQQILKKARF